MKKNSTLFYHEWLPLVNSMPDEKRLKFYDLIFSFGEALPEINDPHLSSVFNFIAGKVIENNDKYKLEIEKRRLAGIKSGESRQRTHVRFVQECSTETNTEEQGGTKRTDKENVNENVNEQERDKEKEIKKKEKELEKNILIESQFESFWQSYRGIHISKGSKQDAKKSFLKALKKSTFEEIEHGLRNYMADCHSKNSYTKQVVVWLNKDCWKDEYSTAKEEPKSDFAKWKELNR